MVGKTNNMKNKAKNTLLEQFQNPTDLIPIDLIFGVQRHFQQYFSYIMATSFSGGRSRSIWREQPTMGKQPVNFITCG
jgi:hypothetical protein